MSKQKRKLKKNQVQVDGNVYTYGTPTYNQMYEDKFEDGDVVWDNLLEEWVSVPKSMNDAWDELYKNQRVGKAQDKVRKGTASFARPILDTGLEMSGAAGAYRFAQDPLKNLQGTYNVLSNFSTPGLAMNAINYIQGKPVFNISEEDLQGLGNTFDVAGLATLGTAPLIKQGLKVAPKLLSSASKAIGKVPKLNPNVGLDFVDETISASKAIPKNQNIINEIEQITTYKNDLLNRLKTTEEGKRRLENLGLTPEDINDIDLDFNAGGSRAMAGRIDYTGNPYVNINLKQIKENADLGLTPMNTAAHEIGHALQYLAAKKRYNAGINPTDFRYNWKDLNKTPADQEMLDWLTKNADRSKEPFPGYFDEFPGIDKSLLKENPKSGMSYVTERAEPYAHLREFRANMMDEGILKNEWDNVTEDMVDKFMKTSSTDRMKGFMENTPDFKKRMSILLNKYPAVIPTAIGTGAVGATMIPQDESAPEQKAYGGKITNMKKNKLPKYQTGGPVDPILTNRLMQYLFGRNTNKSSILDVRSPNEYGVSLGDRFNIQSGLSFDPMTGIPSGYGKIGINNKGFNLGLEKRKGQNTFNVGYGSPNFNIGATYSNTNKMPSVSGNVGYNNRGFNVGVGGNYSPDYKNISANVGYNNKGFNAGLNYDYSGQSSLSGNVGYGNDLFNVGLSGNYAPGDANINLNTTYNLGTRKKQKAEPIPLAFNTPEEIQLIKEDAVINSNEAVGPPKKAYGGKINNKKKKNQLPQMFWGGKLAPQLFDLAANTLINGTTYAVTDMIKAIREPEQEMRPTKMNTGFTMANGGILNNDPTKPPTFSWATGQPEKPMSLAGGYNTPNAYMLSKTSAAGKAYLDLMNAQKIFEGGQFPDVEVNARDTDENFKKAKSERKNKKDKNQKAIKKVQEIENSLGQIALETAIDQIPYASIASGFYNIGRGKPFTGLTDFIKTPLGWQGDAAINIIQDNPTGYSIGAFEDAVLPEVQFTMQNDDIVRRIGNELVNNRDKKLPGIGQAAEKFSKKYNIPKQEFLDFIKLSYSLAKTGNLQEGENQINYEQILKNFEKKKEYDKESKRLLNETELAKDEFAMGGMIKRADGSYSKRGLWDNIRANKGSGKKPTKQMLEQERKIRAAEKAFGGMITPDMYMQQLMYGSYAQGGQVPQNIPVEVEGGEAYELPNGQMGEFEGPSHDNGGIPVALPEQTKVYSKQLKVNGKTMADRKTKREANVAKLEKILSKNPSDKFVREALKRQQETAALEEQQDMAMQEQANQQQQMQEQAQQGMMQEQAMAGLMQDPAMMQQMGMMMYGGKLNKLENGGEPEPIKPLPMKQIYDLRYPNKTIDVPYNERYIGNYSDIPLTEEMFPLQNNIVIPTFYDNNQIKTIPEQDPSPADLLKQKLNSLKLNAFISEPEGPQFTGSYFSKPKPPKSESSKKLERMVEFSPDYKMEDVYEKNVSGMPSDFKLKGTTIEDEEDLTNLDLTNLDLTKLPPYFNTKKGVIMNPLYDESTAVTEEPKSKKQNKFMNWLNKAADETGDFFVDLFTKDKNKPKKEKAKKEGAKVDGNLPFTLGDRIGMAGTLYGGLAPMTATMLNRMMTPKNQNFFREYGAEGLRAMQEAQALSAINRDKQLADIKLGEEASRQRGRNSARGVNTLRAMDIAADMGANQAQNQAYNAYAQQMMQLLGQKAQMENQQDQMVMKGEYDRDLADRQDLDNFYTNLAENFASQSTLMQKQGKDINQALYNKDVLKLSTLLSRYGIGVTKDANGDWVTYDVKSKQELDAEEVAKKLEEEEKKKASKQKPKEVIKETPTDK